MFYPPKKMIAGNIKMLGGPHVARGLDVAKFRRIKEYSIFKS